MVVDRMLKSISVLESISVMELSVGILGFPKKKKKKIKK